MDHGDGDGDGAGDGDDGDVEASSVLPRSSTTGSTTRGI